MNLVKSKQRVADHGEVFTPPWMVEAMLDLVNDETERIDSRFLEPACGSGNFLVRILKRKLAAVQRLMRGESLDAVSRDLNVPVHRLSEWRDRVLMAAESALKERERDDRDDEIARLQAKVGEITMANELLYAKIDKLEGGRPLARRRLRT